MKRVLMIFALLCLAAVPAPAEESPGLPSVTLEKIERLRELHLKAQELTGAEEYRAAMETYQEIILLEPDDESAYANIGQLFMLFRDFRRAREAFQNALSINPENETALKALQKISRSDDSSYL